MPTRPPRRLSRHLWWWVLLSLMLVWATLVATAWYTGLHEAQEINEGRLDTVARLWMQDGEGGAPRPSRYGPEMMVLVWDDATLVHDSHGVASALRAAMPRLTPGLHETTLSLNGTPRRWLMRVHTQTRTDGGDHAVRRQVVTLLDAHRADGLGRDIAEHIVRPALVLLPLVAVILAWAIRRGLQPLVSLSDDIERLDGIQGQTLNEAQPYTELQSTVHAINGLVHRLQAQAERERRFASDVAHELRTPLTALVWQSRQAQTAPTDGERQTALARVEHEALRAGRILQQLLDLARAQGLDVADAQPVALDALCREVVADHAALAHERRHDLSLDAPDTPVMVNSHPTLLALALRNLLDNALRHTPAGSQVWVRLSTHADGSVQLSVDDSGSGSGSGPANASTSASASAGMGIGLTLVDRITQWLGLQWRREPGDAAHPHGHTLSWPAGSRQA